MESQLSADPTDARSELAGWLRTARSRRKMSVEDVAKVTKIQQRILESLEAGRCDVRGRHKREAFLSFFIVSLDSTALRLVSACGAALRAPFGPHAFGRGV